MSQVYINCHPRPSPCAPARLTCPPAGYGIPSRGLLLFPSLVARLFSTLFPSRSPLCSLALHKVLLVRLTRRCSRRRRDSTV